MDVKLLPRPGGGCLWIPLQIITLGVVSLLVRHSENKFLRRMDEDGVETRGGKRIRWAEVTNARPIRHVMGPKIIAEEVIFSSPKGRFALHSRRTGNYQELVRYALERVPSSAVKKAR